MLVEDEEDEVVVEEEEQEEEEKVVVDEGEEEEETKIELFPPPQSCTIGGQSYSPNNHQKRVIKGLQRNLENELSVYYLISFKSLKRIKFKTIVYKQ